MSLQCRKVDVLIVGSGLAAVTTALFLPRSWSVLLVSKRTMIDTNSDLAQGGIASSYLEKTSSGHATDTLSASKWTADPERVTTLVEAGRHVVEEMERIGVRFDRDEEKYALGREGAHGIPRVFHAGGDETGRHVMRALRQALPENVSVLEHVLVDDLIVRDGRVSGAMAFLQQSRLRIDAGAVVLATGGIGGLVDWTSNCSSVSGDGLVLAERCGAKLTHLPRIQFHPTLLAVDEPHLVTEAVRGAGAVLVDEEGNHVMFKHPLGSLAPRDDVARALTDHEGPVYLNTRTVERLSERFPKLVATCARYGVDVGRIPVRPGLHFHMGGIEVDEEGRTTVEGLYAVGEVADTGVHGVNRLASNSLLECWVFGRRLAEAIRVKHVQGSQDERPVFDISADTFQTIRSQIGKWLTVSPDKGEMKLFLKNTHSLPLTKHVTRQLCEQTLQLETARLLAQAMLEMETTDEQHIIARTADTISD